MPVTGELLHSYGTHADVAAQILHRATDLGAGAIVLGPETRHAATSSVNAYIAAHAPGHVIIATQQQGSGSVQRCRADRRPLVGAGLVGLREAQRLATNAPTGPTVACPELRFEATTDKLQRERARWW